MYEFRRWRAETYFFCWQHRGDPQETQKFQDCPWECDCAGLVLGLHVVLLLPYPPPQSIDWSPQNVDWWLARGDYEQEWELELVRSWETVWRKGARCGGGMWCPAGGREKKGGLGRLWGEVGEDYSTSALRRWEIMLEACLPWERREGRMRRNRKSAIYWLKDRSDNFAIKYNLHSLPSLKIEEWEK